MKAHSENDLCDDIKKEIQKNPVLVSQATDFANIAGQYRLTTSQDIATVVNKINQTVGTNFHGYEGTHQFARDIQVFKRLNEEAYSRIRPFDTPQKALEYLNNPKNSLKTTLSGAGQEVDWLREQQGKISALWQKSELLNKNAPGIDGTTVNRFTGETISRTTVKAAQGSLNTNTQDVITAIKNGRLNPDDTVFGVKGMKASLLSKLDKEIAYAQSTGDKEGTLEKLLEAREKINITEYSDPKTVKESVNRLTEKIANGQANISISTEQVLGKMANGVIIGAAIGLTVSTITSFIRYRKGELTRGEAFTEIGEGTVKSAISGAAMAGITLFLPAGGLGIIAGCAIGMYLNASLKNILDEIFGKGAYREILVAGGYAMGTAINLSEALQQFKQDRIAIAANITTSEQKVQNTKNILDILDERRSTQ